MKTKIKPIETAYSGYRFRSRLEARWAVFFDALGVEYEYEKEGYDLGDAGWYLPDFWLPQVNMFAEVKASDFTENERNKFLTLIRATGHWGLELVGVPDVKPYNLVDDHEEFDCWLTREGPSRTRFYMPGIEGGDDSDFEDIERAVSAARSARFEFGENGGASL